MKTFLSSLLIIVSLFGFITVKAQQSSTGNIVISPAIQEIEAKAGGVYDLSFNIENTSPSTSITSDVSIETFVEGSIPGSTNVIPFPADNDLSKWVQSPVIEEFPAKKVSKKLIKLSVPNDTKPGAYLFAVVFQPRNSGIDDNKSNNLILQTRLATDRKSVV